MIIPNSLVRASAIKTALNETSCSSKALCTSHAINMFSPIKPYNRTLKPTQLSGYKHGLYRDTDGICRYNKPIANFRFSDFCGYNNSSQPSTYFVIDSIMEGSTDILDPLGTTLYESINYTCNGHFCRGLQSIDPSTISPYTKWAKPSTNDYGGICFNNPANALINASDVYDVTDAQQSISFQFKPLVSGSIRPFNIFYCRKDDSGYHTTIYPLENDHLSESANNDNWYDNIEVEPFMMALDNKSIGRILDNKNGYPYLQCDISNNFTDRGFNIEVAATLTYNNIVYLPISIEINMIGQKVDEYGQTSSPYSLSAKSTATCKFIFQGFELPADTIYPDFDLILLNADTQAQYINYEYHYISSEPDYPL